MPIRYYGDTKYYFDGWRESKDYQPYEDQWMQHRKVHWSRDREPVVSDRRDRMWADSGQRGWSSWQHPVPHPGHHPGHHQGPNAWSNHDAQDWNRRRHSDWAGERQRQMHHGHDPNNRYEPQRRDIDSQRQRLAGVSGPNGSRGEVIRDSRPVSEENQQERDTESPTEPLYEDHRLGRDRHRYYYDPAYVYIEHS